MSEEFYNNVIRTESERINREQVEIMVVIYESADCVGDHDFRTESNTQQPVQKTASDSVKKRRFRAAPVCLVLLCFLLLIVVMVLSVFIYTKNTNYTEERRQLLFNILNITEDRDKLLTIINNLRDELLNNITNFTKVRDELLTRNANLLKDKDQLKNLLQILGKEAGWFYYQSSLYYLSNETKSWSESRRDCREKGVDLIIINNQQEQDFIKNITGKNEFWIGLTDSKQEGTWKWVDGSKLTSRFWASFGSITEPNGGKTENCAVTHLKKHPELIGWLDVTCDGVHQWICEMNILPVTI